jgi:hypothetical protein
MGWLQILEHLRDSMDALLRPKMNADGKSIESWDVLQENGNPKKAAHASGMRGSVPKLENGENTAMEEAQRIKSLS